MAARLFAFLFHLHALCRLVLIWSNLHVACWRLRRTLVPYPRYTPIIDGRKGLFALWSYIPLEPKYVSTFGDAVSEVVWQGTRYDGTFVFRDAWRGWRGKFLARLLARFHLPARVVMIGSLQDDYPLHLLRNMMRVRNATQGWPQAVLVDACGSHASLQDEAGALGDTSCGRTTSGTPPRKLGNGLKVKFPPWLTRLRAEPASALNSEAFANAGLVYLSSATLSCTWLKHLPALWSKLAPGGILAGDGFTSRNVCGNSTMPERTLQIALKEFAELMDSDLFAFLDQWMLQKPFLHTKSALPPSILELPEWCYRSKYVTASQEDTLAKADGCPSNNIFRGGSYCQYGKLLKTQAQFDDLYFYVEIPKTASSSTKNMVGDYVVRDPDHVTTWESDVAGIKAFTFLRHPVDRFISGYKTIMTDLIEGTCLQYSSQSSDLKRILGKEEPERFALFVDLFVERGQEITRLLINQRKCPCLMYHILSQTWFLNLWPGPIHFVGRFESLEEDVGKLVEFMRINASMPATIKHASARFQRDLDKIQSERDALQKIHNYFAADMERFGYTPWPGFH
eukprot:TRINITY_DN2611_c1_g2_i2.p1 TRINITY_DN2611_c1_g2~~TRINITY_DN2611_c1_g2_i2.p1  ORF type:complete len:590 (+),score=81.62 TRINITY_DN2611_c1_g2_i2:71-1771(+)